MIGLCSAKKGKKRKEKRIGSSQNKRTFTALLALN